MTEQEWRNCNDDQQKLAFLLSTASARQKHLYAAGCCRLFAPLRRPKSPDWPSAAVPPLGVEAVTAAIELAEKSADGPDYEQEWKKFEWTPIDQPNWGWDWDAQAILDVLNVRSGRASIMDASGAIADFFVARLKEVWLAASERARAAAWSAWEATEGTQAGFWQDMRAKLDEARKDAEYRLVGDPRLLNSLDEIQYAEAFHGYGGRESVWQPRWNSSWTATWDEVWDQSWPPFCWKTTRELPEFEEWRIPILIEQCDRLVAAEAMDAWRFGRLSWGYRELDRSFGDECKVWAQHATAVVMADIFQHPFSPVVCEQAWRIHTVVEFARSIYERRDFNRLNELADTLKDAGCDNETLLTHLRSKGPHLRGCWALDLIVGNKR